MKEIKLLIPFIYFATISTILIYFEIYLNIPLLILILLLTLLIGVVNISKDYKKYMDIN